MSDQINHWMAWEGGVDLVAATDASLTEPNVILHVARLVHTPVGSAPSGIVFWQPDPAAPPVVAGFVSTDEKVGAYFGPHIFAGTPFEHAPVLKAEFEFDINEDQVSSRVTVNGHVFETKLSALGGLELINRDPIPSAPFTQQGVEAVADQVEVLVDGVPIAVAVPPVGISGGPAAVFAAYGAYARA